MGIMRNLVADRPVFKKHAKCLLFLQLTDSGADCPYANYAICYCLAAKNSTIELPFGGGGN
jgi:hypothetical protein